MALPSNLMMISPARKPALAAGPPGNIADFDLELPEDIWQKIEAVL